MKKWQKTLIRAAALALLVGIVFILVISSDRIGGSENEPTPELSPGLTASPTMTLTPSATPTASPRPTNTPTPTEPVLPYTDIENINFNNYAGEMASIRPDDGLLTFGDYGYYTYRDAFGAAHTYRISDWVSLSGETSVADGNWFFGGALETPNFIYAEYDYWGTSKHTFYIRVSRTGRNGTLVTSMPYHEKNNYRSLTASNEYSFYVTEEAGNYTVVQADTDGKNPVPIGSFENGERPFGLWCLESELVFFTEIQNGNKTRITLKSIDLHEHTVKEIVADCPLSDYLYVSGRYVFTGVSDNKLYGFCLDDSKAVQIPLWNKKVNDIYYGEPLCVGEKVYLQYFDWSGKSGTDVIPVDLKTQKAGNAISLSDELTYLCGVGNGVFYAESDADYISFTIPR